ncbi:MAG TPA: DNA-3-methyladenine glycosylase 2 family protein [Holosporales bacterium]|nr:DNA-3-methyladenine glycosylase 2 family protein [Holosporales bacterium]
MVEFTIVDIESPYDFDLSSKIFSSGDEQIAKYDKSKYWQILRINDKLMLVVIRSIGTVEKPKLQIELKSNKEILDEDKKRAEEVICSIFNLKFDLKPFYEALKKDRIFSRLAKEMYGLKCVTTPRVFEALIYSIAEQQISLNVALNIEKRLIKNFGDTSKIDNKTFYAFPDPNKLALGTVKQLRALGLTFRKAEYIRDISRLIADGKLDLEEFKNWDNSKDITKELCKIRGIGVWTTEMMIMRGMNKWETMAADDLGLRRCISHYYCNDKKISGDEARETAEKWGKWKGLVSFYLMMAEMFEIQ